MYYLDLTEAQAIALNSWSYFGGRMPEVLTETQKATHRRIREALKKKSPANLFPARNGEALEHYRAFLNSWLSK